jgi:deoxyribonuclease-4
MPWLGSHLSIAGGYFKAVEAAEALGLDTVQIFTKNNNQWQGKPLTEDDIRQFRQAVQRAGLRQPCAHNSYLINLASLNTELWERSVAALQDEVERAEALGLAGVVMHPGSPVGGTPEEGLQRVIQGLDQVHQRTPGVRVQLWLECTAGQGTSLGCRFEHLAAILNGVRAPERLGVCLDTCHLFAAGYPLEKPAEYEATMAACLAAVGQQRIKAFHLNDSKKPLGSRVDRHEHIGEGLMGLRPFRHVLNDPRWADLPMYLETEKGERDGVNLDAMNLATLRRLIRRKRPSR